MNNACIQIAIVLSCLSVIIGRSALAATGWTLVWADEFTQADGTPPNPANWGYDIGGWGWGNGEWEYYTSRTNNSRIENNQLIIDARQESYSGSSYTSARLLTKGKFSWTYGRMEARIKIPRGQGIWPAFWMLGANIDSVNWPACGEIDIMENVGYEPGIIHGTIHGPGYSGGGGIGGPCTLPGGAAYADGYHIYAVEWETNRIRWFMDSQLYYTVTPANLPNGSAWVFTQPQFLLLNVAVGGGWPGYPDGSTVFPQQMLVDYVRVYAATQTNPPACGGNVLNNPGFEAGGLANWSTYGAGFNTLLENSNSVPVHGGSNVFKVFGQFTGAENYSGIFQDVATDSGTTFTANGWALTPAGDTIAIGNSAWLEVSFRNAAGNILSLYRSALVTNSSPDGTWLNLSVTNQLSPTTFVVTNSTSLLVAPVGTAFVRYQVVFRQPLYGAGAVLLDDAYLYKVGAPNLPVPATPSLAGDNLNITFFTVAGRNYQVLYKNDLADPGWQVLREILGDGSLKTVVEPLTADKRFYRVMQLCN